MGEEGQETIEFKRDRIYIERATLRLTTRNNVISMNMLCTLSRQHGISWRKNLIDSYIIEKKSKSTDDLLFDLASKNIPTPTYFVKKIKVIWQWHTTHHSTSQ